MVLAYNLSMAEEDGGTKNGGIEDGGTKDGVVEMTVGTARRAYKLLPEMNTSLMQVTSI